MKTIFKLLFIALVCTVSTKCTTDFDEYNTNHNEPSYGDMSPVNMLQALITNTADAVVYHTWFLHGEVIQ